VNVEFALSFFIVIAVAAFIVKRMMSRSDEPSSVEEIISEAFPFINDPAALHRKFVRDLRGNRIYGAGTITDITTTPETVTIEVRDRAYPETVGGIAECDVVFELLFARQDAPDEAGVDQYVEFTGILIGISAKQGTPVLAVDPGELLYVGDEPSDDVQDEGEDPSDTTAELQ
jgi:hypothetical protein